MLNVVSLLGRLTADPELRHTPNGVPVTTFSIAVSRDYVRQNAERETDFFDVVVWRETAKFVCNYFKKGQLMALTGSLQTRSFTTKEGQNRKVVEIVANNVYFADSKGSSSRTDNTMGEAPFSPRSFDQTPRNEDTAYFSAGKDDDFSEIESDDVDLPF